MNKLSIFISHPSDFLTDHRAHGDGSIAFQFINRLAQQGHRIAVAYSDADLAAPLHENISLHRIERHWPSSRLQTLEYMFRVRSLFKRLHRDSPFDVIHQLNPVFPGLSSMLTGHGVPLILGVFVSGWPLDSEVMAPERWRGRVGKLFIAPFIEVASRRQQRQAAALILGTPSAEKSLHDPEGARSRIRILPMGVDAEEYCPSPIATKAGERIFFVGSLERRKGVFVLAEAFRRIWRACPNARLIFVGKGSQREALESALKQDESCGSVEFLGEVTGSAKVKLLQSADIVAMPSLGEPHGMVAVEAMACGRPVVGTKAGGLQHLIPTGGGRLVSPGDATSLANVLIELLENPNLREEMGIYNRQYAVEHFAWPGILRQLVDIYYSVLQK